MSDKKSLTRRQVLKGAGAIALTGAASVVPAKTALAASGKAPRWGFIVDLRRCTGCRSCSYSGYRGRIGIFELLAMSDGIRMMVTHNANTSDIRAQALKEGMTTMMNDGMRKVKAGITTPSEVLRVTYSPV